MPRATQKEHKQLPILENGEVTFTVDEKLQSLIQFLCDKGILTWNSCQDNVGGTCWIECDLNDWMMMSEISFQSESQALYRFIEDNCEVKLLVDDDGHPDDNDKYWIEGDSLIWSASVRFPKKFIKQFEELVRLTLIEFQLEEAPDS